ncbi:MAG: thioredoxin family protein [Lentisphaerae bacterium]|nr:thioredoxin family protein [Lentisphaerota bacterium]MCP4102121.1 thioredoxin family protein [Lentisphaerota bacterium]
MKKLLISVVALCLGISVMAADGWMTNMGEAMALAKKTNKPILVDFSGSDWCGWCMKLDREVFSQKVFKEYAKDNLILVIVDFPRSKKQSDQIKKQNSELAKKYNINGFPTVLVLDKDGKILLRTGYRDGGAEKYVKFLKDEIAKAMKK